MGKPLVVLNSYDACIDLLEKRSDIYSDRPIGFMANVLYALLLRRVGILFADIGFFFRMGWSQAVVMAPYGDRWRRFRKICAQSMRKDIIKHFHPVQEREVGRYLGTLLDDPDHFMENFRL